MTDKPCTHCHGSGKEPDALDIAWAALTEAISEFGAGSAPDVTDGLRIAALDYQQAVQARTVQHEARIVFLGAALRDVLSFARKNGPGTATIFQVSHEKVRHWRAILDETPGQAT